MSTNQILHDIQVLSDQIGPRPPLSQAVFDAQAHIETRLAAHHIDIKRQKFYSSDNQMLRLAPAVISSIIGLWMTGHKYRWLRVPGLNLLGLSAWAVRQARSGTPTWYENALPQQPAENLIATIPAAQNMRRRVVIVAHVDTDRQRMSSQSGLRHWLGDAYSSLERVPMLAMGLPLSGARPLRRLLSLAGGAQLARLVADEVGEHVAGANDNASGVAMLLALADYFAANPLTDTELVMIFTEADTLGSRGLEAVIHDYGEQWKDAHWIVLDSIGAGELCWVVNDTQRPPRPIEEWLARVANLNRQWGLMGRQLAIPDPASALQVQHFDALTLSGYQRDDDTPVMWRNQHDVTDNIEPAMPSRSTTSMRNAIQVTRRQERPPKVRMSGT